MQLLVIWHEGYKFDLCEQCTNVNWYFGNSDHSKSL